MKWVTVFLTALVISCSSGEPSEEAPAQELSAQQLLQDCVATDLADFAELYNTLLNLLNNAEGAPVPEFNLLAGILAGGVIPWTIDLDGDGANDIGGNVFFEDADGKVTIPFDLAKILAGGVPDNILAILAGIPDGTRLKITYDFNGLLTQYGNSAAGSGAFAISFKDGGFDSATGNSEIRSGNCTFGFDFGDIGVDDFALGGFPKAEAGFDLKLGPNHLFGTVLFDGTDIAEFRGRLDNGPTQTVRIDLKSGLALP